MSTEPAIGLGVVGLGRGFMLTLPALKTAADVRLTAAFDVRSEAREQFSRELGGRAYETLQALLRDPDVSAVYIATPHELHAEQVIAAARAGKHVLVEKPMAARIADCEAMVEAADGAGVVLMVGPSHGFDAPVRKAAELVASGTYGAVRMLTAFNFTDFMYRPRRPEELDPARGGGVVYSQAAHQFDVVRRIVGQKVTEVTAVAGNWEPSRSGDGAYTALVRFAGGAAASLTYSGYAHYDSDELLDWISELGRKKDPSIYGEARRKLAGLSATEEAAAKVSRTFGAAAAAKPEAPVTHHEHFGFVLVSCERADLKLLPDGLWVFGDDRRTFLAVPPARTPRANVIAEFLDAIRGRRAALHDGHWGLATTRCCAALVRSSEEGRPVALAEVPAGGRDAT